MEDEEILSNEPQEDEDTPASDLLPDRDVLMMEKPLQDNRASRYRPADKKLLRTIVVVVLFLIAALIILFWIVRSYPGAEEPQQGNPSMEVQSGGE
ncbi:MAG TPA: hypothetical protein P5228_01805 [Bacteroidales bacterium]|nr:hypothetical protein [Bacteroidales bacterium]HRZ48244.1 hypothetical protein [Bacteroidales bacterium]